MEARVKPAAATMMVPHGPASVRVARHRLRSELTAAGVPDGAVDDATLVLSELLSNAFRHGAPLLECGPAEGGPADAEPAGGSIRVRWSVTDGRVNLEVTDGGGATRPLQARPTLAGHGGRGLSIVGVLARHWGVRDTSGEVTVWAELQATQAA